MRNLLMKSVLKMAKKVSHEGWALIVVRGGGGRE